MTDEEKSLEEWIKEERARLKKGFTYTPPSRTEKPDTSEDILAGLGLGAAVAGGTIAPHPNPTIFEGVKAETIIAALEQHLTSDEIQTQVSRTENTTVVTFLHRLEKAPYRFLPALTATLLETSDTLTITLSDLSQDLKREALASAGSALLQQGGQALYRGATWGLAGLLDAAGNVIAGVEEIVEEIQKLGLPKRVWEVVDRVGNAAQEAYRQERRKEEEARQKREEAERAWTHCPSCGRAYQNDEAERVNCPSCGAPRGSKPPWIP